jgi:hypothetical protein
LIRINVENEGISVGFIVFEKRGKIIPSRKRKQWGDGRV